MILNQKLPQRIKFWKSLGAIYTTVRAELPIAPVYFLLINTNNTNKASKIVAMSRTFQPKSCRLKATHGVKFLHQEINLQNVALDVWLGTW